MHDTRDSAHFAHRLDPRTTMRIERVAIVLFLAGLVAAAFAFPYI